MKSHPRAIVLAGTLVCLLSGCGAEAKSALTVPANCNKAFDIQALSSLPYGSTPRQALNVFFSHGSVNGILPPEVTPRSYGLPASGWRLVTQHANSATFQSGKDRLDVVRLSHGKWEVDSGELCT
jgi:hypothetical protein